MEFEIDVIQMIKMTSLMSDVEETSHYFRLRLQPTLKNSLIVLELKHSYWEKSYPKKFQGLFTSFLAN